MNDDHPILAAIGLVAVGVGVLMVLRPGLAATISTDYAAVTIVGLLALVQGVRVVRARQATELEATETPDVETVETMPTPGHEFDERAATLQSGPRRTLIRERADLRERLETAAVTAIADRENCSDAEARERLAAGTWTDDPHAATFLGGPDAPRPPLLDRLRVAASGQSVYQFRIRRTADAVARLASVEAETEPDADTEDESNTSDDAEPMEAER